MAETNVAIPDSPFMQWKTSISAILLLALVTAPFSGNTATAQELVVRPGRLPMVMPSTLLPGSRRHQQQEEDTPGYELGPAPRMRDINPNARPNLRPRPAENFRPCDPNDEYGNSRRAFRERRNFSRYDLNEFDRLHEEYKRVCRESTLFDSLEGMRYTDAGNVIYPPVSDQTTCPHLSAIIQTAEHCIRRRAHALRIYPYINCRLHVQAVQDREARMRDAQNQYNARCLGNR